MMKAKLHFHLSFSVLLILAIVSTSPAQQRGGRLVSPEIHPDRRVTFRLRAPQAQQVSLSVEFASGLQNMAKDDAGVWSITLGPAEPDIYSYSFRVDGLQIADPGNPYLKIGLSSNTSLLESNQKFLALLQEKKVKHIARITEGGHTWRNWRSYLHELIPQLFTDEGERERK